jgi:uncharacterized protein (DUF2141 family)
MTLAILSAVLSPAPVTLSEETGFTIEGDITFPKSGDVYVQLATEEEYSSRGGRIGLILPVGEKELDEKRISFRFVNVPTGVYGIRCFQDVNGNGKLDSALGPTEPWGMYRNKRPAFRGPRFDEISFELTGDLQGIRIELK